jgi:DNA processing protein
MNNTEALLVLNAVESVGPVRIKLLVREFGSPAAVLAQPLGALKRVKGVGEKIARNISEWEKTFDLEKELALIASHKVSLVTCLDGAYPALLKEIYDPPAVLYVAGVLAEQDRFAIGVVGSRWASHYGKDTAQRISADLARRGITIVSGMARGIDTCAHRGALSAGGRTIAVLGNGLARCYPPENKELMEQIAQSGAVISEFPMEMIPDKGNFPRRNRVISGLSLGIIVAEAARRSGALITASHALEQNRTVLSIPGRVGDDTAEGSNDLIKQGAKIVTSAEDVLEEFEYLLPETMRTSPDKADAPSVRPDLSPDEETMYNCVEKDDTPIDALIEKSGLPAGEVSGILLSLELKNLIKQRPGKQFVKV